MDKLVKSIKKHYQQEQNKEVDVKVAWRRVQCITYALFAVTLTVNISSTLLRHKGDRRKPRRKSCVWRRFTGCRGGTGHWGEPRRVREHTAGQRNWYQADHHWGHGSGWCCSGTIMLLMWLHYYAIPNKMNPLFFSMKVDNGVAETKETKKRKTEDMEVGHSGTTDKQDGRKGRRSFKQLISYWWQQD